MLRAKGIFLIMCGLLSGCLSTRNGETVWTDGIDILPDMYCSLKGSSANYIDWSNATILRESVKDSLYKHGLLQLKQHHPYIIRIANEDAWTRSFRAPEFFEKSIVVKAKYQDVIIKQPCMEAFTLAPGASAELYVVPSQRGLFDYHNTLNRLGALSALITDADIGLIHVY
ncbi:MAG: hypothetical protein CBB68_04845 [Rhodospirillaceae bacterium TMED8]|nr:hypothetical protein [Magnetovibrio sp.]OUT51657.1 MAG: hypothetical protein CBB68_04845 [Rhodospirillaceae bacterium TMED8]|tara:strand:- start:669 stop:1181 length:513 start_codon:yes stop_codon:yes gene_type:complete